MALQPQQALGHGVIREARARGVLAVPDGARPAEVIEVLGLVDALVGAGGRLAIDALEQAVVGVAAAVRRARHRQPRLDRAALRVVARRRDVRGVLELAEHVHELVDLRQRDRATERRPVHPRPRGHAVVLRHRQHARQVEHAPRHLGRVTVEIVGLPPLQPSSRKNREVAGRQRSNPRWHWRMRRSCTANDACNGTGTCVGSGTP